MKALATLLLATILPAQTPPQVATATVDTSIFWASIGDPDLLLVTYAIGAEAGNMVTVRDPAYWSPPFIGVRLEPVWAYAKETRPQFLGMKPCFHVLSDRDCQANRTIHLNVIEGVSWMDPFEFTPSMPHHAIWRMDYPGGAPWLGGVGTPELVVVWYRVVVL